MQWYRELNKTERRTFIAAFGGWAIDALDFMVFTFVIATLMTLWGIDKGQAGMLGTVTLLFSAIGGWLAGILADRYGRVRVLQYTPSASRRTSSSCSCCARCRAWALAVNGPWARC